MENQEAKNITRTEIAQWYGVTERALRNRMKKANLQVTNRILTKCDIRLILTALKEPQFIQRELYHFYMVT